jgi:hypothetical protein
VEARQIDPGLGHQGGESCTAFLPAGPSPQPIDVAPSRRLRRNAVAVVREMLIRVSSRQLIRGFPRRTNLETPHFQRPRSLKMAGNPNPARGNAPNSFFTWSGVGPPTDKTVHLRRIWP